MTTAEKALFIIENKGACEGISCYDGEECPCIDTCIDTCDNDITSCDFENTRSVQICQEWLCEHQVAEVYPKTTQSPTQESLQTVLTSMTELLIDKNRKYGNSALEPMDVFTKHLQDSGNSAGCNSILVRLDDKLKRIQNADTLRKNDVADMIGYLTLLCVDKGWTDFSEFKD
jgi:hypothetical protein